MWSLDFCMVCDQQTAGGPYCSQACRLSEMDRTVLDSEPTSPTLLPYDARTHDYGPYNWSFEFPLHPTLDSTVFRSPATLPGRLASSPSQTSLSSLRSTASQSSTLPSKAQVQLDNYSALFDKVRDLKRRLVPGVS